MKFLTSTLVVSVALVSTLVSTHTTFDDHLAMYGAQQQYRKWPASSYRAPVMPPNPAARYAPGSGYRAPNPLYGNTAQPAGFPINQNPIQNPIPNSIPPNSVPNPNPNPTQTIPNPDGSGVVIPGSVPATGTAFQPVETNLNQLGSDFSVTSTNTATSTSTSVSSSTSTATPASMANAGNLNGAPASATSTLRLQGNEGYIQQPASLLAITMGMLMLV